MMDKKIECKYKRLNVEGVAYCSSVCISGNISRFVFVDLIGKNDSSHIKLFVNYTW